MCGFRPLALRVLSCCFCLARTFSPSRPLLISRSMRAIDRSPGTGTASAGTRGHPNGRARTARRIQARPRGAPNHGRGYFARGPDYRRRHRNTDTRIIIGQPSRGPGAGGGGERVFQCARSPQRRRLDGTLTAESSRRFTAIGCRRLANSRRRKARAVGAIAKSPRKSSNGFGLAPLHQNNP